jgi:uncharacterized protein (TIGR03437 family)
MVGPFNNSSLGFTDATGSSTLSLVNLGSAPASVTLRGANSDGTASAASPPAIVVPASQQYLSAFSKTFGPSVPNLAWVRADVPNTQTVGAEILTGGTSFDVLPAPPRASIGPWVVAAAEQSSSSSTQLRLTNPGTQSAEIDIYLQGMDGSDQGTYTGQLDPKQQLKGILTTFFPGIPDTFQGYAIVWSDQPITVAEFLDTASTRAALNAQIPGAASPAALYAPRLGSASGVTTLTLVNPTSAKANITVKGFGPNGAPVGNPAAFSLAAGQQYRSALSAALGIADTQAGTLSVTSDQPGLVGHLDLADPFTRFRATMPLDPSPAKTLAIPYVGQGAAAGTSLSISNVSGSPANVTIKAFNTNGTAAGTKSVTLAPNAQAADTLANLISGAASLATGFVTITSDQPVTAAALLTSGVESALLPGLAATIGGSGPGGPTPQINGGGVVNAAAFTPKLARGALATIFGSNLASGIATAQSLPLLTSMGGVTVLVGNVPAPLVYVSPGQINFQVPFEVPLGSTSTLMVLANGVPSASVPVTIGDYGVGIFTYARTSSAVDPIIVHGQDNTLVTPAKPAVPGETLVAYATGIGKLNNQPASGAGSPSSPLATAVDTPTATLGGTAVKVVFAGLTPGFIGLVQLNLQLPANLPTGSLPLVIQSPGDSSSPVNLAVAGNVTSAPKLTLSTSAVAFGNVAVGQSKDLQVTVSNTGSSALNITASVVSGAGFSLVSSVGTFALQPGGSAPLTIRFAPAAVATAAGALTISSNDPGSPATVALSGAGIGGGPSFGTVLVSDSFNRPDAGTCSVGVADLAYGGAGSHYYLPIFSTTASGLVAGALQNNSLDYGGVQLTGSSATCGPFGGETFPQDLYMRVDLLVPASSNGVVQAGPYFRSRSAGPGDGIIGGTSAGYWVALTSAGEVMIRGLNPNITIATTGPSSSFNAAKTHTLELTAQGQSLTVYLDGSRLSFTQNGASVLTVALPVSGGTNNGTAGIAFGAEANRGKAGGQRAQHLVIATP